MKKTALTVTIERSEYENMNTELRELKVLVEYYKHQLLLSKRRQFGASSEKLGETSGQLNLYGQEEIALPPDETEEISYSRKKRKGKREEDLSGLPVERIDYELPESERACPECGETMRDIGVQIRRELKLIPAKVVVLEHATHTYACRNCEKNGVRVPITRAAAPAPLIIGSLASPFTGGPRCRTEIRQWDAAVPAGERLSVRRCAYLAADDGKLGDPVFRAVSGGGI